MHHVDVSTLNDENADVLVALGSQIRVLSIDGKVVSVIAPWNKAFATCTNLETVHLTLESSSALAVDVFSLMPPKLVSSKQHNLDGRVPIGGRFFLFYRLVGFERIRIPSMAIGPRGATMQVVREPLIGNYTDMYCETIRSLPQ